MKFLHNWKSPRCACLKQAGRNYSRSWWHATLNTSYPTLKTVKLISNLKYFAKFLCFHYFYSQSSAHIHIHKGSTQGFSQGQVVCNQETQVQSPKQKVKTRQKTLSAWVNHQCSFQSCSCLLAQWWFTASTLCWGKAKSGFPSVLTTSHICDYFHPLDSMDEHHLFLLSS